MNHEKLENALNEVRDVHICEAAKPRKRKRGVILRMAAAAAMVAILVSVITMPRISATAVSLPDGRRTNGNYQQAADAAASVQEFFVRGTAQFISGEENAVWSPVNALMGLAMAAEITDGNSRRQILDALGVDSLETLRADCANIWEYIYRDGNEISVLANSLWLDQALSYEQETLDALAYHYYADVYKGKMGSSAMNRSVSAWINKNTGGMLKAAADNIRLTENTVLALYSTVYLRGTWSSEFRKANNTEGIFHGANADSTVTYMNKKKSAMTYYWGENFSAVSLHLKNGATMYFLLPDEGYTPADLLDSGDYMQLLTGAWENQGEYNVNLSVPKFDVSTAMDLREGLKTMGITDMFDPVKSDFSAITSDEKVAFTAANQNIRVMIDEEGVKAAAYFELPAAGSAAPPEETVDFVLDRPFVFAITKADVPLFVGTVTQP